MRRKPCHGPECREWCEECASRYAGDDSLRYGSPTPEICQMCGFEGPMSDWYAERDAEEEDASR